jgi:hypothetical protein
MGALVRLGAPRGVLCFRFEGGLPSKGRPPFAALFCRPVLPNPKIKNKK